MHPVFIEIFGRPIYWYGVLTAAGFLAAVVHWSMLARRHGRDPAIGSELGIWIMVGGILGARVAFVLANLPAYLEAPMDIIRIDKGGLIYYGGFIGASLAVILMAHLRKERLWDFADFVVTAVPLGHAVGRVGCFLNGCCYGTACDLPWAVSFDSVARHPTQLYETAFNLLLYGLLLWIYPRRKRAGAVFALYMQAYGLGRFIIEFVRGDDRMQWFGLSVAQQVSIGVFLAGCALWWLLPRTAPGDDG